MIQKKSYCFLIIFPYFISLPSPLLAFYKTTSQLFFFSLLQNSQNSLKCTKMHKNAQKCTKCTKFKKLKNYSLYTLFLYTSSPPPPQKKKKLYDFLLFI
ncbi:hypothetical protein J3Q64DRAFT_1766251 [Phycomyces blakesleeanus]|uniref:Secreted protein n=1 Tax=Phycomyces blakesleeanus TaxID=4837 RepID=A0ABR3AMW5_PHYBL